MRTILRFLDRQRKARPLAMFTACFAAGMLCVAASTGADLRRLTLCAAAALTLLCAALLLRRRNAMLAGWLALICAFAAGMVRFDAALALYPPVEAVYSVNYTGTVVSDPFINANDRLVCLMDLDGVDGRPSGRHRIRLYLRSEELPLEGIEYGQRLSCFGHVWPQDHATNPYQSDNANRLLAQRITGMGAAKLEDVEIVGQSAPSPEGFRLKLRHGVSAQIDRLFPYNADLVRAFVLGDRTTLDYETRDAFSKSGVAHLICISGLHISLLAMVVLRLLNRILPRRRATVMTLAAVLVYGWLIGFPNSMIRAIVMFAVFSLGPIFGRSGDAVTRWSLALTLMLLGNPFNLYDVGFILSFAASAGILLLTEPLEALFGVARLRVWLRKKKRMPRLCKRAILYFPALLCATLAAQLASLPFVLDTFHLQPLIAVPVNLAAIPLAMAAYPLSLIALICSAALPLPAAIRLAAVPDGLFRLLMGFVRLSSGYSAAALRAPRYPMWLLIAHCAALVMASSLAKVPLRRRRFLPIFAAGLVAVSIGNAYLHSLGCTLIFFDAGQADAALMTIDGHNYIYDVGDAYTPIDDYVSAACLGVDAVFLSHPQYDHVGGLKSLLEACTPKVIYVPAGWDRYPAADSVVEGMALAEEMGVPIVELSIGDTLTLAGGAHARVYGKHEVVSDDPNDVSLLLCLTCRGDTVFYTGDISSEGEPAFIPDVDILKVPHHGSKYAADERLLSAATPRLSIISVGDNNYGHPSPEVLDRLKSVGSEIMRTDECGAITIRIGLDGAWTAKSYLRAEDGA